MRRSLFFSLLLSLELPVAWAQSCRPVYDPCTQGWCGLPENWGGYRRYNPCCLNQDLYTDLEFGAYSLGSTGFAFGEILFDPSSTIGPIPEFHLPHRDRIAAFYPRLALGVEMINAWTPCWVGSSFFFEVAGSYITNDRFSELGNGTFVFYALPSIDGGGDFIAGLNGVSSQFSGVDFKRKYCYGNLGIRFGSSFLFPTAPRFSLVPFLETDFNYLQQKYRNRISRITGPTAATQFSLIETLNTQYYDLGAGTTIGYAFCNSCRTPFVYAEATGFVSGAHTRLSAFESAIISPATTASTVSVFRKHDTLSGKFRGQVGVGYQFGYNFSVSVVGQIDYWGYIPIVVNPNRINTTTSMTGLYDRPVHIEQTTATNYALTLNVNILFF